MYLVDTNVISEARKGKKANRGVQEFWRTVDPDSVYLAVQTIGEIRCGIERIRGRGDAVQARALEKWLNLILTEYEDRILPFDADCAQVWGKLMSPHRQHPIDKQLPAIALIYNLEVVTRNVDDFAGMKIGVLNPFV